MTGPIMKQTVKNNDFSAFVVEVGIKASDWRTKVSDAEAICRTCAIASWHAAETPISLNIAGHAAEASVILTDDKEMARLNEEFRTLHGPTNVLAFPGLDGHNLNNLPKDAPVLLGDCLLYTSPSPRD